MLYLFTVWLSSVVAIYADSRSARKQQEQNQDKKREWKIIVDLTVEIMLEEGENVIVMITS
jgi:hypothetical protein